MVWPKPGSRNDHDLFGRKVGLAEPKVHDGSPKLNREVGKDHAKPRMTVWTPCGHREVTKGLLAK